MKTNMENIGNIVDGSVEAITSSKPKVGKYALAMLKSNPKICTYMKELESVCDNYNLGKTKCQKNMIIGWAYAGCVLSALNGERDPTKGLIQYIRRIDEVLADIRRDNIEYYVPQIFEDVFEL